MKNEKPDIDQVNAGSFHVADISCHATWKKVQSQYIDITGLYIGKVKVASYCWDGACSRTETRKYSVSSQLPTIKSHIGRFETEEECRQACIEVAQVFCKQLQYVG